MVSNYLRDLIRKIPIWDGAGRGGKAGRGGLPLRDGWESLGIYDLLLDLVQSKRNLLLEMDLELAEFKLVEKS